MVVYSCLYGLLRQCKARCSFDSIQLHDCLSVFQFVCFFLNYSSVDFILEQIHINFRRCSMQSSTGAEVPFLRSTLYLFMEQQFAFLDGSRDFRRQLDVAGHTPVCGTPFFILPCATTFTIRSSTSIFPEFFTDVCANTRSNFHLLIPMA